MYLFKNAANQWIMGNTDKSVCPAGIYRLDPSVDKTKVTIKLISNDKPVYDSVPIGHILKIDGSPYSDFTDFETGTSGFFDAPLSTSLNAGSLSVNVSGVVTSEEAEGTETSHTIALATVRYWPSTLGVKMNRDKITCKLKSTNLSADTTVTPQFAMSDGEYADGESNLEVITHTFKKDVVFKQTYEADRGDYFRLAFGGVTTGDVAGKLRN